MPALSGQRDIRMGSMGDTGRGGAYGEDLQIMKGMLCITKHEYLCPHVMSLVKHKIHILSACFTHHFIIFM